MVSDSVTSMEVVVSGGSDWGLLLFGLMAILVMVLCLVIQKNGGWND